MTVRKGASADAPINPDVESYCWHEDGWESAGEFTVHDARAKTRGQAAALFARFEEYGHLPSVRVWKRYVRQLTRLDVWADHGGADLYRDTVEYRFACPGCGAALRHACNDPGDAEPCPERLALIPDTPPAEWEPDPEGDPVWEFVPRDHPDAIPVWICASRGSRAPHDPSRTAAAA